MHREPILLADGPFQISLRTDIRQVQHGTAAVANEVTVGSNNGIKSLLPLDYAYTLDQAVFLKKVQVAVDRAQTQVGVPGFELAVKSLSGGVAVSPPEGG